MKITLLATSDTHGFIEPTNYVDSNVNKPFGLKKASSTIKRYIRQHQDEQVILVDNGDFLQGSPMADYAAKRADESDKASFISAYNQVGYQIGSIGNHEFDYGLDYLNFVINHSTRQFVCANIVDRDNEPMLTNPYTILNVGGIKIGFLGLTTTSTKKWKNVNALNDFNLISELTACKRYIPELREKADLVIVVYHGGFERDHTGNWNDINPGENRGYDILKNIKGIDGLISGHQHRKIASELFKVPIIQPGSRGEFVGKISFEISNTTKQVTRYTSELLSVADNQPDKTIAKQIAPLSSHLQYWLDKPLSHIDGDLTFNDPFHARIKESAFIEFIQKVQMAKMGTDISATALYNNEAHGFESPITMRNIITNYVYPNTLVKSRISGADLRAALEVTAKYFDVKHGEVVVNEHFMFPKERFYNYDMYEGIEYTLNIARPIGQRVTRLKYHGRDVTDDQVLFVTLNRYRASGGGHYPMYTKDKIVASCDMTISQIILEYLQKHPLIKATNNHNFKIEAKD
ncbi:bifunctional metallophosphatase/5'-nucleotidase [Lentilactobacillus farraginis]|uniref:2',3'-cyclic-nucleotide 2'-phosphodiesterase n=1 Tax=Lentilactobacillus farraginis DSM 18382 = JCM 14108 TaxID=1423743 RepID=X0QEE3_9LACO|nr:bifunctional UDP-sugar hydrolase/5'-nucleotidase [Lentilactobacillus farraginis]KRM04641.1 nucleotidase [Lentilactobacillus farraginis DSM 18382 = JCM 14108]GAF36965.1 2',3'-cyclic-nucleotide 2'-phosphodiesterase [Lentilactobacillus farraginis DSM 18382 = JCM 14108]